MDEFEDENCSQSSAKGLFNSRKFVFKKKSSTSSANNPISPLNLTGNTCSILKEEKVVITKTNPFIVKKTSNNDKISTFKQQTLTSLMSKSITVQDESPSTSKKKFTFKSKRGCQIDTSQINEVFNSTSPTVSEIVKNRDNILDQLYKSNDLKGDSPVKSTSQPVKLSKLVPTNKESQLKLNSSVTTGRTDKSKYFASESTKKQTCDSSSESPILKPKKVSKPLVISSSNSNVDEEENVPSSTTKLNSPAVTSSSDKLSFTDADYMDDDEFEKRFGSILDNLEPPVPSTSQPTNDKETVELLNDISNMNWDDNAFDDEPIQQGFKDRNDDSAEFSGDYEHSCVMMEVLQEKFGLRTFRPHQREIINASLMQHDCFVLMPTGGGKSLCYQLPAILMPGVTIVISPLRALISDQVDKLNALDIAAAHLCSDVSKNESDEIYMRLSMREPGIKLLYLTPEKIVASAIIINMLDGLYQRGKLARFVIDEVHCLSQWGHDFRPDYKQLGLLRQKYAKVPIICLTATATKQVENDVVNILHLKNVKRFIRSFNRPNIKYQVIEKKGKCIDEIANLIKSKFLKKSGIVYCLSRNDCDKLAEQFNRLGVKSKPYHAGMNDKVREVIQREWMQDRFHVIVATIAFGMGIDKPDVRFVIHNSIPKSVEAFYQESGRAGRDGEVSYSYLFYNYGDVGRLQKLVKLDRNITRKTLEAHDENLKQMVSFAENVVDCRRYLQLIHLGEQFDRRLCIKDPATICDNCENIDKYKPMEVTQTAKQICTIVKDLTSGENVTLLYVADVYRGAKIKKILDRRHDKLKFYGAGAKMDRNDVHRVLKQLLFRHVLQDFCAYTGEFPVVYIKPGKKFYQFLNSSDCKLTISVSNDGKRQRKQPEVEQFSVCEPKASTSKEPVRHTIQKSNCAKLQAARKLQMAQLKVECHEALLEECRRLAMESSRTLSSIMNLSAIKSMSDTLPATKEDMLKIQHVTAANYSKYGDFFLQICKQFREKHDQIAPLAIVTERKSELEMISDESDDFSERHSFSMGASGKSRGTKRKSGWQGGKKGGFKKRKVWRKKKTGSSPKKAKGWTGKKGGGGGSGLGLMPVVHFK